MFSYHIKNEVENQMYKYEKIISSKIQIITWSKLKDKTWCSKKFEVKKGKFEIKKLFHTKNLHVNIFNAHKVHQKKQFTLKLALLLTLHKKFILVFF